MLEIIPYEPLPENQTSSLLLLDEPLPELENNLTAIEPLIIPEIEPEDTEINILSSEELTERIEMLENPYPSYQAGEDIAQYSLVFVGNDGKIYKCDAKYNYAANCIGLILANVSINQFVSVKSEGEINNDSWNFDTNKSIFVGENGQIAQEIENDWAIFLQIGTLISPNKILLHLEEPICLTNS